MTDPGLVLHPRWVAWALESLAEGAVVEDLVEALTDEGLPEERARGEVELLAASPALTGVCMLVRRIRALEQALRLRLEHRRARPEGSTSLARGPFPGVTRFLAENWVPGVPAVFTDLVATPGWTLESLAERHGDALVEACVGRGRSADPECEWQSLRRELPLRELVRHCLSPETGNDIYMLAKNNATQRPSLAALLAELVLPPVLFGQQVDPRRTSLWIGPAGTHTPLHHDIDNSLLCQISGRKRVRLAPPESVALLALARGVYSRWDPTSADEADAPERLIEAEVGPGEALFIPAGWWHQVDALTPSITVTALGFVFPNDHAWYRPGALI
ncbi:MAG: cupin-like domain-containing protein [Nannocystis sp.]|nr:cupin-like domain-containing protein [Nannocystis sp.]